MMQWWSDTPAWQRYLCLGLSAVFFVLGMHTWIWSSLDKSISTLHRDIAELTEKNQEVIQDIASLSNVEQEVTVLREEVLSNLPQLSRGVGPQNFRREIVKIGDQTEVSVRLWKPEKPLREIENADTTVDIVVRVEGSFYGTVEFLDELLQLSWIQSVDPLVLKRNPNEHSTSSVITDFTIKGVPAKPFLPKQKLLKT